MEATYSWANVTTDKWYTLLNPIPQNTDGCVYFETHAKTEDVYVNHLTYCPGVDGDIEMPPKKK